MDTLINISGQVCENCNQLHVIDYAVGCALVLLMLVITRLIRSRIN